jgi:hypothetical protein
VFVGLLLLASWSAYARWAWKRRFKLLEQKIDRLEKHQAEQSLGARNVRVPTAEGMVGTGVQRTRGRAVQGIHGTGSPGFREIRELTAPKGQLKIAPAANGKARSQVT